MKIDSSTMNMYFQIYVPTPQSVAGGVRRRLPKSRIVYNSEDQHYHGYVTWEEQETYIGYFEIKTRCQQECDLSILKMNGGSSKYLPSSCFFYHKSNF